MKKNKDKTVQILGLVATGLGIVGTLLSNWVASKNLDATVERKVQEAISTLDNNNNI